MTVTTQDDDGKDDDNNIALEDATLLGTGEQPVGRTLYVSCLASISSLLLFVLFRVELYSF